MITFAVEFMLTKRLLSMNAQMFTYSRMIKTDILLFFNKISLFMSGILFNARHKRVNYF
jgi:predicted membrane-bound mannosyltransferase